MKIKIDEEFTTLAQAPKVREDIKTFKAMFTEADVTGAARAAADFNGDLLSLTGEAFPGGYFYKDATKFHFIAFLWDWSKVIRVSFYCDMDMTIDNTTTDGKPMTDVDIWSRY